MTVSADFVCLVMQTRLVSHRWKQPPGTLSVVFFYFRQVSEPSLYYSVISSHVKFLLFLNGIIVIKFQHWLNFSCFGSDLFDIKLVAF
jgi:hypothetical protein